MPDDFQLIDFKLIEILVPHCKRIILLERGNLIQRIVAAFLQAMVDMEAATYPYL